jgi:putative serine protease PepD
MVTMSDTHPTQPLPHGVTPTPPASGAATHTVPPPPYDPFPPPPPQDRERPQRRAGMGMVLATGLLAGALGAGLGAGAVIATNDDTSPASTADTAGGADVSATSLPDGSISKVAAEVLPGVVSIQFSGPQGGGSGSGVVIDESGLILTNNHVVEGAADGGSLTVSFQDGTSTSATIVGRDPTSDLAVIRVENVDNLVAVPLGSSEDLRVGETVIAVGSPLGLNGTVTTGIVSAKNRPVLAGESATDESVLNAIQTDAAINPGNSGGALVDLDGKLVGINSAIATLGSTPGAQSGSIGLGFAIPIDQAKWISQQLIDSGTVEHARLGVSLGPTSGEVRGATIESVEPGSTADDIGLEPGDVVTGFGQQGIDSSDALVAAVRSTEPGTTVKLTYVRDGDTNQVDVTLEAAPSS